MARLKTVVIVSCCGCRYWVGMGRPVSCVPVD